VGNRVKFIVPGQPVPLARARLGKFGRFYTLKKCLEWQRKVHLFATAAGLRKTDKAIAIKAVFYRSDNRRLDIDNLQKNLFDALRYFFDDSQIIEVHVAKRGCEKGAERTEVEIWTR